MSERSHGRAAWAAFPLIAFRGAAGGMPILVGLLVAHQWGLDQLAPFTVANAAVAVAMMIADWGATRALPRNLATLPADAGAEMLASSNAFRFLLAGVLLVAGAGAAAGGWISRDVAMYGAILFPLCVLNIVTTNGVSERVVTGNTQPILWAVVAGLATFALGAAAVLASHAGPRAFVAAYVAGKMVESAGIAAGRAWVLSVSTGSVVSTAAALWPFSLQMILGVVYSRLSVFTVERMASRAELGVFSVAIALYSALLLIPTSIALVQFPELTRRIQRGEREEARHLLRRYAIISGLGVSAGVLSLAVAAGFLPAVLRIPHERIGFVIAFTAVAFLSMFGNMAGFLMQAAGLERLAARLSLVTVVCALLYQVGALAWFGLWGVVYAAAAAELTSVAIFGAALARTRRKNAHD